MSEFPIIWDPKNPDQSLRYAISWYVRRTGHLPMRIVIPEAIQIEDATAQILATQMKALDVTITVDEAAPGIVCQGQGKPGGVHQLPWRALC